MAFPTSQAALGRRHLPIACKCDSLRAARVSARMLAAPSLTIPRRSGAFCVANLNSGRSGPRRGPVPRLRRVVRAVQAQEEQEQQHHAVGAAADKPFKALPSNQTVARFYAALNGRQWDDLQALLSPDCVLQNMACDLPAVGGEAVVDFYRRLVTDIVSGPKLILEEITMGDPSRVGLVWHIELEGVELPLTKGLSFFRLDARGRISSIRENPEHFLKLGGLAVGGLGAAAPLIRKLGPAALPAFWFNLLGSNQQPPQVPGSPWYSIADTAKSSVASMASPDMRLQIALSKNPANSSTSSTTATSSSSSATSSTDGPSTSAFADGSLAGLSTLLPGGFREAMEGYLSRGDSRTQSPTPVRSRANSRLTSPVASKSSSPISSTAGSPEASKSGSPTASMDDVSSTASSISSSSEEVKVAELHVPSTLTQAAAQTLQATPAAEGDLSTTSTSDQSCATASSSAASASSLEESVLSSSSSVQTASPLATSDVQEEQLQGQSASAAAAVVLEQKEEAVAKPPAAAARVINLSGIWEKDLERSEADAYDKALDVWNISGMQKATAHLIEGLELQHAGTKFSVNFLTIIPYFKVTENFTVGTSTKLKRRDLRSGESTAIASAVPTGIVVKQQWGEPYKGTMEEQYLSPEEGVLHVISTISVGPRSATTLQVYKRRAGADRQQLLKESEARNGNHKEVLKRFGVKLW